MKKSINIKDFVSSVDYKIGEGYEYRWDCYGQNACGLEWARSDLAASADIISRSGNLRRRYHSVEFFEC